jgi:hypothetical protein
VPLIHEAIWKALCQIGYWLKQQRARRMPVTVMERPVRPPGSVAPLTVNWDDPVDIEF